METPPLEAVHLDTEGLQRKLYLERRDRIEHYFLDNPPKQNIVELEDGAKINVLSSIFLLPDNLKSGKPRETTRVAVFVTGMFQADKPNYGNHPLESKLAGAILTGDADAFVVLKGEGLNPLAYKDEAGNGKCEEKVSGAAAGILISQIDQLKKDGKLPDKQLEFEVSGYSEGSTQAPSVAARLAERRYKVRDCVSVGGAGLVGYDNQNEADVPRFIQEAVAEIKKAKRYNEQTVNEGPDTIYVDKKIFGDVKEGGLETSLGRAKVNLSADIKNIGVWGLRYLASEMGIAEQVPHERLQATCTKNPDYEVLAKSGIPIIVISGAEEIFFPNTKIRERVDQLRRKYGSKVVLISSNIPHVFPHSNPSGIAYLVELAKSKFGIT